MTLVQVCRLFVMVGSQYNVGEPAVRMLERKQKVAGYFRRIEGEYHFIIRAYIDTMRKQGHNSFDAPLKHTK